MQIISVALLCCYASSLLPGNDILASKGPSLKEEGGSRCREASLLLIVDFDFVAGFDLDVRFGLDCLFGSFCVSSLSLYGFMGK